MAEEKTPPASPSAPPADDDSVAETKQPEKEEEQAAPEEGKGGDTEMKNGEQEQEETSQAKPEEPEAEPEKEAEKEADDAAPVSSEQAAESAPAPEANGAPSSTKKGNNGKRKSTGTVPEHKSKKLNKKKSSAKITHLDAKPGEYYFARLKSYAPWPSIICDEEMLPQSLLSTRPVTTKKLDGTYNPNYADGGKRVQDRTFPIMFLHTNEFAWIPNTELTPLDPESCKDVNEKGKAKALVAAYHVAAENHDLQYFKDMLADHQRAMQEDQEAREARAAAKAAKAAKSDKKKRKSTEAVEEDEDVEMVDAEDEAPKKTQSAKKRRKAAESEGENEKPAKTPKTATKLKLTTPKNPKAAESGKKSQSAKSKGKSSAKKNASEAASDEETVETPKEPEKMLSPKELKAKKEKEVLYLRHKLQKGFLSRDQAPKEEEMADMSNYIQKLEQYNDLEVSIIRQTKINKVLKAIIKLNTIPKEEEYRFRQRSVDILGKWKHLLESDIPKDEASGSKGAEDEPKANGVHKKANGKKGSETPASEEKKEDAQEDEGAKDDDVTKEGEGDKEADGIKEDVSMADAGDEESKKQTPEPAEKAKQDSKEESKEEEKTATTSDDVEMEGQA